MSVSQQVSLLVGNLSVNQLLLVGVAGGMGLMSIFPSLGLGWLCTGMCLGALLSRVLSFPQPPRATRMHKANHHAHRVAEEIRVDDDQPVIDASGDPAPLENGHGRGEPELVWTEEESSVDAASRRPTVAAIPLSPGGHIQTNGHAKSHSTSSSSTSSSSSSSSSSSTTSEDKGGEQEQELVKFLELVDAKESSKAHREANQLLTQWRGKGYKRTDGNGSGSGSGSESVHASLEVDFTDSRLQWRLARSIYFMITETHIEDKEVKARYLRRSLEVALASVKLYEPSPDAHKWVAILSNKVGDLDGTQGKIKGGHQFQIHTLRALELSPNDATLHHMLGRFQYELSSIPWVKRQLAKQIFGELPASSYEQALRGFNQANTLRPRWIMNLYWLGKTLSMLGRSREAKEVLEQVCRKDREGNPPPQPNSEEDREHFGLATELLDSL